MPTRPYAHLPCASGPRAVSGDRTGQSRWPAHSAGGQQQRGKWARWWARRGEGGGVGGVGGGRGGAVCRLTSITEESPGVSGRGDLMKECRGRLAIVWGTGDACLAPPPSSALPGAVTVVRHSPGELGPASPWRARSLLNGPCRVRGQRCLRVAAGSAIFGATILY